MTEDVIGPSCFHLPSSFHLVINPGLMLSGTDRGTTSPTNTPAQLRWESRNSFPRASSAPHMWNSVTAKRSNARPQTGDPVTDPTEEVLQLGTV